jgi:hypothetical protein
METHDGEGREKRSEEADGAAARHLPNEGDTAAAEPSPPSEHREIEEMGGEAACQLHRWMDVDD